MDSILSINMVFCIAVVSSGIAHIVREYYFGNTHFWRFLIFNVWLSFFRLSTDINTMTIISIAYLIVSMFSLTGALISRSVAVEKERSNDEKGRE